jgi:hypothetical protein
MEPDRVMKISHLRDNLGWAYREVARTDIPIIVQRYGREDVAIVAKWEWDFLRQLEVSIKARQCPIGREKGESCPCSLSG